MTLYYRYIQEISHGFLYHTRTDFIPLADSQKKAKIYSVFLYPVYSLIHYNCLRCVHTVVLLYDVVLVQKYVYDLRGVHTVVHKAILPRTFVRARPSQTRTRTKVRVRVRVRRPPTMLDFLYVVHVYEVQMYELAVFR